MLRKNWSTFLIFSLSLFTFKMILLAYLMHKHSVSWNRGRISILCRDGKLDNLWRTFLDKKNEQKYILTMEKIKGINSSISLRNTIAAIRRRKGKYRRRSFRAE
jgi:hypothetical protein